MTLPSLDTLVAYSTFCFAIAGALLAAVWLSLIIWTFRDMRARSRDPFAQILATVVVALLPVAGLLVYLILRPRETLTESYERALEEEALLQEIEEKPICPGCSRTTNSNWLLCPHCHTRLHKACPDCNSLMELQWTLCPYCGNQHVDPYNVGPPVVLADEVIVEEATGSGTLTDNTLVEYTPADDMRVDDVGIDETSVDNTLIADEHVDVALGDDETTVESNGPGKDED